MDLKRLENLQKTAIKEKEIINDYNLYLIKPRGVGSLTVLDLKKYLILLRDGKVDNLYYVFQSEKHTQIHSITYTPKLFFYIQYLHDDDIYELSRLFLQGVDKIESLDTFYFSVNR